MASKIDPTLAKSLIKEFRNQNEAAAEHALKTPEGQHLHGYFINRESLESILSDPKVVGISLHHAKHPDFVGKKENVFTTVMVGAVANTSQDATTPYVSSGDYYDKLPNCPPTCTSLL
jgi:hypothetical protein